MLRDCAKIANCLAALVVIVAREEFGDDINEEYRIHDEMRQKYVFTIVRKDKPTQRERVAGYRTVIY
jgi:hypothetical protein